MGRTIPGGLWPHFGSGYWGLHRDAVKFIHQYVTEHPEYVKFFEHSHTPDESFFQVILMNNGFGERIVNRSPTYVEWRREPKPALLGMADLPLMLESDCLFARKFDEGYDVRVMDELDKMITR